MISSLVASLSRGSFANPSGPATHGRLPYRNSNHWDSPSFSVMLTGVFQPQDSMSNSPPNIPAVQFSDVPSQKILFLWRAIRCLFNLRHHRFTCPAEPVSQLGIQPMSWAAGFRIPRMKRETKGMGPVYHASMVLKFYISPNWMIKQIKYTRSQWACQLKLWNKSTTGWFAFMQ